MFKASDCSDQQIRDYRFVRPEFDVTLLVVFLGVLRLVNRRKALAYTLDVVSSAYLLWATYTRQFYLHNTSVGQWANDLCSAIVSDKDLIYNYLAVSVVSWVASSFLECNSVIHLKKLYSTRLWKCLRGDVWLRLSRSRWLVLTSALTCTVNSLVLTLVLWSTVHHSFENVSQDGSILTFNTIAALMRLLRQFLEGLAFIAGIVTRDFRWRSVREEKLMGRIAFSSLMLLIHSSVLTYTFCTARVWSVDQLILFSALLVDVIFQVVVCSWAAFNSCCYARAKKHIKNLAFHRIRAPVKGLLHLSSIGATFVYSLAVRTVHLVSSCTMPLRGFLHFCVVAVQTILLFTVGAVRLVCFCINLVLTVYVEAWRNYALHWHIDVDFNDQAIELVEPVQIQLVYQEMQGHEDVTNSEVVFPSYSVCHQYNNDPPHTQWNVPDETVLISQYATQNLSVVFPFPPSTIHVSASSHSTFPPEQEPPSQLEEGDSTPQTCLPTFELSPQPESVLPHMSSQSSLVSSPQLHPVRHGGAIVAPSFPSTKLYGQCSELVVR